MRNNITVSVMLTISTLAINQTAAFAQNIGSKTMTQQENITQTYMPKNYKLTANQAVIVDNEKANYSRYEREDKQNNYIGGEHFSTVYSADGKLKGFTRMDASLVGLKLPLKEEVHAIAMEFLTKNAPELINGMELHFIAPHDELVIVSENGQKKKLTLTGMKVKARDSRDGRYFWVIIGGDKQVMTFERDIVWNNLPYGHRQTEKWLHDSWLREKQVTLKSA